MRLIDGDNRVRTEERPRGRRGRREVGWAQGGFIDPAFIRELPPVGICVLIDFKTFTLAHSLTITEWHFYTFKLPLT